MENLLRERRPETEIDRGIKPCSRLQLREIESRVEESEKAKEEEMTERTRQAKAERERDNAEGFLVADFSFSVENPKNAKHKKKNADIN